MRMIVMRHGQTEWNSAHRIQGHTDIPLDARGQKQAEAVAERLKDMDIRAVYTSPLMRAHVTAQRIAERCACPVIDEARLIERYFGDWEGECIDIVTHRDPETWKKWIETPSICEVPGGETLQAVLDRSISLTRELIEKHKDENIVLVSHANPAKLILLHYANLPIDSIHRIRLDNCSYSELYRKREDFVMTTLNETYFLQERGLL